MNTTKPDNLGQYQEKPASEWEAERRAIYEAAMTAAHRYPFGSDSLYAMMLRLLERLA